MLTFETKTLYSVFNLTNLHPVGFSEPDADARSKDPSRHTADHYRHALSTGAVAFLLYLSAQFTIRKVSLVACAADREAPVVLLSTAGQQSEKES